jgi:hypothetical protein
MCKLHIINYLHFKRLNLSGYKGKIAGSVQVTEVWDPSLRSG